MLKVLGIPIEDKTLELWPSESGEKWAEEFLNEAWVNKEQFLIGINPGASLRWSTKKWPVENFAKLCDMLANRLGVRVLLTGTKEDLELSRRLFSLGRSRPIVAMGKSTILQLVSLIRRCNVFITSDSAPMHIAAACKVGFVALFGPTDPKRHMPFCEKYVVIRKKLKCSPCYSSKCIKGLKCMKKITVEEVFEAVKQLLPEKI